MVIKNISLLFTLSIICLVGASCSKDNNDNSNNSPVPGNYKVAEGYALGAATKVVVYTNDSLKSGYNNIYVELYDSLSGNKKITSAAMQLFPEMTMNMNGMTMKHGCPVENPAIAAGNSYFTGAICFTMPSSDMNYWTLKIHVQNKQNAKEGDVSLPVKVTIPAYTQVKSFATARTPAVNFTTAIVLPRKPVVGVNDFEMVVFQKIDAYTYTPVTNCSITIDPEMPSMGHGSPNNVNPVHIANGHYKGKVNYTMTGEWRIDIGIQQNNADIYKGLYFDQMVN